jgi:hypothetical protein
MYISLLVHYIEQSTFFLLSAVLPHPTPSIFRTCALFTSPRHHPIFDKHVAVATLHRVAVPDAQYLRPSRGLPTADMHQHSQLLAEIDHLIHVPLYCLPVYP